MQATFSLSIKMRWIHSLGMRRIYPSRLPEPGVFPCGCWNKACRDSQEEGGPDTFAVTDNRARIHLRCSGIWMRSSLMMNI